MSNSMRVYPNNQLHSYTLGWMNLPLILISFAFFLPYTLFRTLHVSLFIEQRSANKVIDPKHACFHAVCRGTRGLRLMYYVQRTPALQRCLRSVGTNHAKFEAECLAVICYEERELYGDTALGLATVHRTPGSA